MSVDLTTLRREAINNEPIVANVNLGEIRILSPNTAQLGDHQIKLSDAGFAAFQSLLGLDADSSANVKNLLGEDSRLALVSSLQSAIIEKKGKVVDVLISPRDNSIIGVRNSKQTVCANDFFNTAEYLMERYGDQNLVLDRGSVDINGNVTLGTKTDRIHNVDGLENENFHIGIGFNLTNGNMELVDFVYRLICTNGMYGQAADINSSFGNFNKANVASMISAADKIVGGGGAYENNVRRAMNTFASVNEVFAVNNQIARKSVAKDNPFNDWFTSYDSISRDYAKIGYPVSQMSVGQRKTAVTEYKVWDVINALTNFASHDQVKRGYSFNPSEADEMLKVAGRMLRRERYDMHNMVPSPYQIVTAAA